RAKEISVGKRLRQERLRLRLSQEELAEELGVTVRSIGRWERGQALPYPCHQKHLCRIFCADLAALFGAVGQEANEPAVPLPSYHTIPYRYNPLFTGRQQILHQIHDVLRRKQTIAPACPYALTGLGGIGNTQIALE